MNNIPCAKPRTKHMSKLQVSDFGHSGFTQLGNRSGAIIKCKAGICLRGDSMIDNSETHAPVVQWSAILFFVIILICLQWMTRSVDWVNVFPQAPPDKPTFMRTPRGFMNKCGKLRCLKVTRSLCGSKFAPRTWHLHLREVLLKLGF